MRVAGPRSSASLSRRSPERPARKTTRYRSPDMSYQVACPALASCHLRWHRLSPAQHDRPSAPSTAGFHQPVAFHLGTHLPNPGNKRCGQHAFPRLRHSDVLHMAAPATHPPAPHGDRPLPCWWSWVVRGRASCCGHDVLPLSLDDPGAKVTCGSRALVTADKGNDPPQNGRGLTQAWVRGPVRPPADPVST